MRSFRFAAGVRYETRLGEVGVSALKSGWSAAEAGHVWSEGVRAKIVIPLAKRPNQSTGFNLVLEGNIIPGEWAAEVYLNGHYAGKFSRSASAPREVRFEIPVVDETLTGSRNIEIDLVFETARLGRSTTSIEGRDLSLALIRFEMRPCSPAFRLGPLHRELGRRPNNHTVCLVGEEPGALQRLRAFVAAGLLSGALTFVHDISVQIGPDEMAHWPSDLEVRWRAGSPRDLIAHLRERGHGPDLIVLSDTSDFSPLIQALAKPAVSEATPTIVVINDNVNFTHQSYWDDTASFASVVFKTTVMLGGGVTAFVAMSEDGDTDDAPPCTLYSTIEGNEVQYTVPGRWVAFAWTSPTLNLLRDLFGVQPRRLAPRGGAHLIQYDDYAHTNTPSAAFGRRASSDYDLVQLAPDVQFFESRGYERIRAAVTKGRTPRWKDRQATVFWRGSPTNHFKDGQDRPVERLEDIPRVAMCLALKDVQAADAAIMGSWAPLEQNLALTRDEVLTWLADEGIIRPHIPMLSHSNYRYLIDIDGVANAWSFFEKLLLGACVLKVASPFEQWFYKHVEAWWHYVPVNRDLSDLREKIDWCLSHEEASRKIARQGQKFALSHTYTEGRKAAIKAIERSISGA